jgi:hypothetical protein
VQAPPSPTKSAPSLSKKASRQNSKQAADTAPAEDAGTTFSLTQVEVGQQADQGGGGGSGGRELVPLGSTEEAEAKPSAVAQPEQPLEQLEKPLPSIRAPASTSRTGRRKSFDLRAFDLQSEMLTVDARGSAAEAVLPTPSSEADPEPFQVDLTDIRRPIATTFSKQNPSFWMMAPPKTGNKGDFSFIPGQRLDEFPELDLLLSTPPLKKLYADVWAGRRKLKTDGRDRYAQKLFKENIQFRMAEAFKIPSELRLSRGPCRGEDEEDHAKQASMSADERQKRLDQLTLDFNWRLQLAEEEQRSQALRRARVSYVPASKRKPTEITERTVASAMQIGHQAKVLDLAYPSGAR